MAKSLDNNEEFHRAFPKHFASALAMPDRHQLNPHPNLMSASMTCVLLDQHNQPLWQDPRFSEWIGLDAIDPQLCDAQRGSKQQRISQSVDRDGLPLLLIYAPLRTARYWPVDPQAKAQINSMDGALAIGAFSLAHLSDDLIHAARAFGLTPAEARLAAALISQGNLRSAAEQCGITYSTARKSLGLAMGKMLVSNQSQLVRKLSNVATSVSPPRESAQRLLADIFGLSARDSRLALLIAEGNSRDDAARIVGVSKAVAKDSFARIFETMGIGKATEIARIVSDAFFSALFADADRQTVVGRSGPREPLTIIHRPDGSMIAVSDYGPKDGRPVLILHSSLTTRYPIHRLVRALRDAGFRPITMDRPGFGLSDDLPDRPDLFSVGAGDVQIVCHRLEIDQLDMVTRGACFPALAIARQAPDLIGRCVLINPDLLHAHCSKRAGNLGLVRLGFERFPGRIDAITRWLVGQLSPERIIQLVTSALRGHAVDLACFDDPENRADYQRSGMVFATGRLSGFVREQRGYCSMPDVEGLPTATDWTLLIGASDPIHEIDEMQAFWKAKLPGVSVKTVADGGRFLEMSHPSHIVAALRAASDR